MERIDFRAILARARSTAGGQSLPLTSSDAREAALSLARWRAEQYNDKTGTLVGLDCPACKNRGYFAQVDDEGRETLRECSCMAARRSLDRIKRSGLADLLTRYTLETWEVRDPWQEKALNMVRDFAKAPEGWFLASGRPGTGKSHLCTALCGLLLNGGMDVRYMLWRDESMRAKAAVTDAEEYARIVAPLKAACVLYIDDLFKTGRGQTPSPADVSLAFELLNARYNDGQKITIISTEYSVEALLDIDEAVGSRIYERSKKYYLCAENKKNWRLGQ